MKWYFYSTSVFLQRQTALSLNELFIDMQTEDASRRIENLLKGKVEKERSETPPGRVGLKGGDFSSLTTKINFRKRVRCLSVSP